MTVGSTALLSLTLFGFWIVLSGHFDAFHLSLGAGSAVAIALWTGRLLALPPAIAERGLRSREAARLLAYLPWLAGQVVIASLQVARVVIDPQLPVEPRLLRLRVPLPHGFARLVLANSITLTPGTVTVDVDDDVFVVHALTPASAAGLGSDTDLGPMPRRVQAIFED